MDDNIMDGFSKDIEQAEKDKLRALFPQCFVEDKLDIDKLLNLCGEYIDDDSEKYEFKWHGKYESLKLAQKRTAATLRPCREESLDFDTTQNLYLEGDNLEVLKLLQASYYHKIKMIYIDPPYNTGNDFVYADDFADSMEKYKEITSQTTKSNPETMGRFHTNWLNMMYPRLRLAANLLRDDGVIFISIDDNEVHNLRKLCDEVFGEENFLINFAWRRTDNQPNIGLVAKVKEYILCYSKNKNELKLEKLSLTEKAKKEYRYKDVKGVFRRAILLDKTRGRHYYSVTTVSGHVLDGPWMIKENDFLALDKKGGIYWTTGGDEQPYGKIYLHDSKGQIANDFLGIEYGTNQRASLEVEKLFGQRIFDFPKPLSLIKTFIQIGTEPDSIIIDFFSGSGTTAHAVMQLNAETGGNRRFIMVQLPELCEEKSEAFKAGYHNICEIGKERIRRGGTKIRAEQEAKSGLLLFDDESSSQLDIGFKVFKLDTSNLNAWDSSPILDDDLFSLQNRLNSTLDRVKSDRSDLDMVYEVMFKMGVQPTEAVTTLDICDKKAYCVCDDCQLLVCLAEGVTTEMVEQMADYSPARIIFGQECFKDVSALSNAKLTLQNRGIEFNFI